MGTTKTGTSHIKAPMSEILTLPRFSPKGTCAPDFKVHCLSLACTHHQGRGKCLDKKRAPGGLTLVVDLLEPGEMSNSIAQLGG